MKNKKRITKTQKLTFSKWLVIVIVAVSVIDMQIPFILAFLGRDEIAETLAVAIVTEIIGIFATYSAKAFFENKEMHKNDKKEETENEG